jgi:hypothetical protein
MTALACETLLVSAAGSRWHAGDRCARLRNRRWRHGRSCDIHEAEIGKYPVTPLWRVDQAAQVPPATSLHAVKSP